MDLLIISVITIFFGFAILSTVAQRGGAPTREVIVVRAEQLLEKESERGEAGFGIFLLVLVIIGAIWLL